MNNKIRKAQKVLRILRQEGFEAYLVGGVVRDYLLKQDCNDIDITTNARPMNVQKIFRKTIPTGIKYGTITVIFEDVSFEVTTYRTENEYLDSRHPSGITYGDDVIEDCQRRDFTINALLMDEGLKVIDHVGGMDDLNSKTIRAIGDADERFKEDALRILRAIYFQGKLGFMINSDTFNALKANKDLLLNISNERVMEELSKIVYSKNNVKAFDSLLKSEIASCLDGLEKGIKYFNEIKIIPSLDMFYIVCFILNGFVPSSWKFSNKQKHKFQTVMLLASKKNYLDPITIYEYGLEYCVLANRANLILKKDINKEHSIKNTYDKMSIKSELELKLPADQMALALNKKQGAWISLIRKEMVCQILLKKLKNEKDELLEFAKANVK